MKMNRLKKTKKVMALFTVVVLLLTMMPWTVLASSKNSKRDEPKPEEPYQKVIFKNGNWFTEYFDGLLCIGYNGSKEIDEKMLLDAEGNPYTEIPASSMSLSSSYLLKGIFFQYVYSNRATDRPAQISVVLKDSKGNMIGPYYVALYQQPALEAVKDIVEPATNAEKPAVKVDGENLMQPVMDPDYVPRMKPEVTTPSGVEGATGDVMVDTDEDLSGDGEIMISVDEEGVLISEEKDVAFDAAFIPSSEIMLKAGTYKIYVSNADHLVRNQETDEGGAVLVKGILKSKWIDYKEKLELWELSQYGEEMKEEETQVIGNEDILISVESPENFDTSVLEPYTDLVVQTAHFEVTQKAKLTEIGFNMFNNGKGINPGLIYLADENGKELAIFQAYGASLGETPNGLWLTAPNFELEPGLYYLYTSKDEAAYYDPEGNPDFYVQLTPFVPVNYNFTGTYRVDVQGMKKTTLMGAVAPGKPSFDVKDLEVTVLDKGTSIEIVGKYEGIPFSQVCEVTQREENKVISYVDFAMDLTNLPYKAKITAGVGVVFEKPENGEPTISITGLGTYERQSTKTKGGDYNTYSILGKGKFKTKELPLYVIAALNTLGSAGNVPGPDGLAQAATGTLFPPLSALIAHLIQTALQKKAKEEEAAGLAGSGSGKSTKKHTLSVGEQAMADANNSLGKGLYDEKEAEAWGKMADALGNSDEPDADPESMSSGDGGYDGGSSGDSDGGYSSGDDGSGSSSGDDGSGYEDSSEEGNDSGDYDSNSNEEASNNGDATNNGDTNPLDEFDKGGKNSYDGFTNSEAGKIQKEIDEYKKYMDEIKNTTDPNDPRAQEVTKSYQDYINSKQSELDSILNPSQGASTNGVAGKTMTVQLDHTGRTGEITFDDTTGDWIRVDEETGQVRTFDMNRYEKDVLPNFGKDKGFIDEQRKRLENRDTPFDKAMDSLVADQKYKAQVLTQLQKWRNESYGIMPPSKGVGDVNANIKKLMDNMNNMTADQVRDQAKRIGTVVGDRRTGKTADESSLAGVYEGLKTSSILVQTAKKGAMDVTTGRTWAGMGGRIILAGLTGGVSEIPLSVGEAMVNIHDSINQGESGTRATLKAMGQYILGELGGEYLQMGGKAVLKGSGYQISKEGVSNIGKFLSTPVSEVPGKVIGKIFGEEAAKAGVRETFEKFTGVSIKNVLGNGVENASKNAADNAKFGKFQSEVSQQVKDIKDAVWKQSKDPLAPGITKQQVLDSLNNPAVIRNLKDANEVTKKAYQDALGKYVNNPPKATTEEFMKNTMMDNLQKQYGKDVNIKIELETIRTPGKETKGIGLNSDNDLTGKITIEKPDGTKVIKEVKASEIKDVYNKSFADQAGMTHTDGKFNVDKASSQFKDINWNNMTEKQKFDKYAELHGQSVTDIKAPEAAGDFSKIGEDYTRPNATKGISNVENLYNGKGVLSDPQQLAQMETYKVNKLFNEADELAEKVAQGKVSGSNYDNRIIANQVEAFEQLKKMGQLTEKLDDAYKNLGYETKGVTSEMKKALEIVGNGKLSPGARTLELQKLGFDGPKDVANKLSSQIEGMQKLSQPVAGSPNNTTQAIISSIIKSHLSSNNQG